jgi:2-aminoadipate transaminase
MPTYQNPTGRSLSSEKRHALLRTAAAFDLPIVEDDSAGFFNLASDAPAPASIKADDTAGYVIHLGTFSKLIAAGLRLGWLVADPAVFDKLVAAKYASDLSSDALVQRAVHRLLVDGALDAHLSRARAEYRVRRDALLDALHEPDVFPPGVRFDPPDGGFNLWLDLPREGPSSTELFLEAVRRGVAFVPGPFFFSAGSGGPASSAALRGLRLSYSALAPAELRQGVERLGAAAWALATNSRQVAAVVY